MGNRLFTMVFRKCDMKLTVVLLSNGATFGKSYTRHRTAGRGVIPLVLALTLRQ